MEPKGGPFVDLLVAAGSGTSSTRLTPVDVFFLELFHDPAMYSSGIDLQGQARWWLLAGALRDLL